MEKYIAVYILAVNKHSTVTDCYPDAGWQLRFRRNLNDWKLEDISQLLNILEPVSWMLTKRILGSGPEARMESFQQGAVTILSRNKMVTGNGLAVENKSSSNSCMLGGTLLL